MDRTLISYRYPKRAQDSRWMRVGAVLVLAGSLHPAPLRAQDVPELGTLFYTAQERQAIIRARQSAKSGQQGADAPIVTTTQLSGIVRRADRRGTVWINGQPHAEGSAAAGVLRSRDTTVLGGHRLRVGESVDTLSGARGDVVMPGAVQAQGKP